MRIQSKYLEEKLTAADPTSKWISDFVHSDNPKFAGKSKKERIRMALGASYAAKGQSRNEETAPPFTPDNNKAPIAKPGKAGYGPSAAKHLAKMAMKKQKNEEVEQIDEVSADELLAVGKKVSPNAKISTPETRKKDKEDYEKRTAKYAGKPNTPSAYLNRPQSYPLGGYDPKSNRSYSEEVELDEMDKSQPSSPRGAKGLPLGKKAEPVKTAKVESDALKALQKQYKKVKEEVEIEEGIGSAIGGAIGQYAGSKMGLEHPARAHGELLGRAIEYHVRKLGHKIKKKIMGEEQESLPASKALQKAHDEERMKRGLPDPDYYLKLAAQKKKEIEDMKRNEEVEQIDELKKSTLASYAKKATRDARIKMATGKDFERISKTSKKPAYKASAKEWEDKYKSDARRREAGVNKAIDRLAKEEVEQVDELKKSTLGSYVKKSQTDKSFYAADIGRMASAGDTASSSYDNIRRKHKNRGAGINRAVDRLTKEEVEQVDEISQNTALNAYAQRAARAATTKDPKDQDKADKSITRIGKRWTADAQRRAWNRADKLIYKEETEPEEGKKKGLWDNIHAKRKRGERPARPGEKGYPKTLNIEGTELDEAGRMQGGGKDPCWKGYKMIGTKNKAGREVPNCVPVKEEKTFKSLREELNGNDQSN